MVRQAIDVAVNNVRSLATRPRSCVVYLTTISPSRSTRDQQEKVVFFEKAPVAMQESKPHCRPRSQVWRPFRWWRSYPICDEEFSLVLVELDWFVGFVRLWVSRSTCKKIDCPPFIHVYIKKCSNREITISIRDLPITDLHGTAVHLPFYVLQCNCFLLVVNNIILKSDRLNNHNHFVKTPCQCELSEK